MKVVLFCLVILSVAFGFGFDVCGAFDENRVDCGYYGIKQDECEHKGCCWRSPVKFLGSNTPYCFRKLPDPFVPQPQKLQNGFDRCGAFDEARVDCGFVGISVSECEHRGCCYREPVRGGDHPYCFQKLDDPFVPKPQKLEFGFDRCGAFDEDRVDCGFVGISVSECEHRGCCYRQPVRGGDHPYCFQKLDDPFVPK